MVSIFLKQLCGQIMILYILILEQKKFRQYLVLKSDSKMKLFAWKFIQNSPLTINKLRHIGMNVNGGECPFFQKEDENSNHLLNTCELHPPFRQLSILTFRILAI